MQDKITVNTEPELASKWFYCKECDDEFRNIPDTESIKKTKMCCYCYKEFFNQ